MNPSAKNTFLWLALVSSFVLAEPNARAQSRGAIEGRVLNADSGEYLYQARLTLAGTSRETFTDQLGSFRFNEVPEGLVRVRCAFTGFTAEEREVKVTAGSAVQLEIPLRLGTKPPAAKADTVIMSEFVVAASKEMTGAAMAVNTQRFAPNTMNVVSTDEFGFIADGNIGSALKFLPGVQMDYDNGGVPSTLSLSGAPSASVPVTVGGFAVATASDVGFNTRATSLLQMSLTNFSRIEVSKTPTPESPGNSLAGYVNLVPRSAFEFSKPRYNMTAFASALQNHVDFKEAASPLRGRERQVFPGGSFSATVPVNKRFGFTLTGATSVTPNQSDTAVTNWAANYNSVTGQPVVPYYSLFEAQTYGFMQFYHRRTLGLTLDFKITPKDVLSLSSSLNDNEFELGLRRIRYSIGRTNIDLANSSATVSRTLTAADGRVTVGSYIQQATELRNRTEKTYQPALVYRHTGEVWNWELGASYGYAKNQYSDLADGHVFQVNEQLTNIKLTFSPDGDWDLKSITATKALSATAPYNFVPVSPYDTSSYLPFSFAAGAFTSKLPALRFKPELSKTTNTVVRGNLERSLDFRLLPTRVKLGADVIRMTRDVELPGNNGYYYTGTSANVAQFIDPSYDLPLPGKWGVPPSIDSFKLAAFFKSNPTDFARVDEAADWQTTVQQSKHLQETVASAFLRFDNHFFNRRLWAVWGVRVERTEDEGVGSLNLPNGNYVKNAAGQVLNTTGGLYVRGVGSPALIHNPANSPADSLAARKLQWIYRGASAARSYSNWFPSLNLSGYLTSNLVVRASVSTSIGRPDFGSVIPGIALPDYTTRTPAQANTTLVNTRLNPWTSTNYNAAVEYYFEQGVGDVSLRAYSRQLKDAFGSVLVPADQKMALYELYGVDTGIYGDYNISTTTNLDSKIESRGLELSTRYNFDRLLPGWARGIQANGFLSRHVVAGSFTNRQLYAGGNLFVVPWSAGWGLNFSRSRLNLRVNWKWDDRQQRNYLAPGTGANQQYAPDTYRYFAAQLRADSELSIRLSKMITLSIRGVNINRPRIVTDVYGPATPEYARHEQRQWIQPYWTGSVNASF